MPWNRKRKKKEGQKNAPKKKEPDENVHKRSYHFNVQHNAFMESYYALQGLFNMRLEGSKFVPCRTSEEKEAERGRYSSTIRSILPASFRIGTDCDPIFRKQLKEELDSMAGSPIEIVVESTDLEKETTRVIPPVRSIPFIPLGYQLSVDRRTIRRNSALTEFHEWLKVQTDAGFITRQETVSMIPPVVLGVESHHKVLDMCAAPGSKTSQILETVSFVPEGAREPQGFVLANDSDPKRAYMLITNLRRINSPAVFATSVDAQFFPQLQGYNNTDGVNEGLFDRVLCDVPCTGDGTMRKNPGIWRQWNQLASISLHPLQLSIAVKGATLCKVGGYMCYSTCSMNPIENEAIVAEILRMAGDSLELVDKRLDMSTLVARPGWATWKVMTTKKKDKNKLKKNSHKMLQKRKEWADKQESKRAKISEDDCGRNESTALEKEEEKNAEVSPLNRVSDDSLKKDATTTKEAANNCSKGYASDKHQGGDDKNKEEKVDANVDTTTSAQTDFWSQPLSWDENSLQQKALDLGFTIFNSFDDVPKESRSKIRKSCFPPTQEEIDKFHLERCMRCLPQDMNTGGFFIALFRKVKPVGVKARDKNKNVEKNDSNSYNDKIAQEKEGGDVEGEVNDESNAAQTSNVDDGSTKEPPVENLKALKGNSRLLRGGGAMQGDLGNADFVGVPKDTFPELIKFYGLNDDFPKDQIMARSVGGAKVLYFLTRSIKEVLIDSGGIQKRVTVINSGLKAFQRDTLDCTVRYRLCQEGIHMIMPYLTQRKFVVSFTDFITCLNTGAIYMDNFSDAFRDQIQTLSVGTFVIILEGYENDITKKLFLVMWRCRSETVSINCMVGKIEMEGMKSKLRAIAKIDGIDYVPDEKVNEGKAEGKEN